MKSITDLSLIRKTGTQLFHFTPREERMMECAIALSKNFMKSYGKGRDPYMVDIRHYKN